MCQDQKVININEKTISQSTEDFFHGLLEDFWSVCQAKRENIELENPQMSYKSRKGFEQTDRGICQNPALRSSAIK